MKIFVDENILIKDRVYTAGMLAHFKPPYSATVVERIIAAGMEITDSENEADAFLCAEQKEEYMLHIKPTYGTVSRFGLVAGVSSMEQIGVSAHEIATAFYVLSVIAGHDKNDGTSYLTEKYEYVSTAKELKIVDLNDINFEYMEHIDAVYTIIAAAEFSANISRYDGLKYGYRTENFTNINDLVINSRSEGFTLESKLKALMGAYVLSEGQFEKYYLKATKIRRLVKQELEEIFKQADVIHVPDMKLACLSGCPAIMMPGGYYMAREFDENKLYALRKELSK